MATAIATATATATTAVGVVYTHTHSSVTNVDALLLPMRYICTMRYSSAGDVVNN